MRYKEVAERLAGDILKRKRPGDRLPGVRELAKQENISLVTARNVYQHLMGKGLVISRQGVGTFVAYGSSGGVIDMATIRPPEELLLWVGKHLNITIEGLQTYDPPQGYEPLRQQARKWMISLGIDHTPIITAGSQQALFLVGLALLKKGDVVAVEDPGYMGAVRIFESLGAIVKTVPYISSQKDLDRLGTLGIRLFYTMPQGHIPTGGSIPEDLRDRLLEIARKKDFFIIEDDPLSEVEGIPPLKARDTHERVVYIKSLSNILGPGLRIGFAVVPSPHVHQIHPPQGDQRPLSLRHTPTMPFCHARVLGSGRACQAAQDRTENTVGLLVSGHNMVYKRPLPVVKNIGTQPHQPGKTP